jgi:hypothetical protein
MKNYKLTDKMFVCNDSGSYFNTRDSKVFLTVGERFVYVSFSRSNGSYAYSNSFTSWFLVIYRAPERMTSVPKTEDSMFNCSGFNHSPLQKVSLIRVYADCEKILRINF